MKIEIDIPDKVWADSEKRKELERVLNIVNSELGTVDKGITITHRKDPIKKY